jgi:hypothetical protein
MMWEACRDLLAARGHETLGGVCVETIRHRNGRVECVYGRTGDGQLVEFDADHFISTLPLRELIYALDPPPPIEVLAAANHLRYRDYLTVVLIIKRESIFPDNWVYIHSPEVKMGRIQNYKNWSPEMVPDPLRTSLGLEYFLWDQDEEWEWPRERLIEFGVRECARIGVIDPGEVEDGTVVRMRKAYPVYDQHYQESLGTVRRYLATLSNFQTVGRNGLHRYNNQDHSMLTAIFAARNIAGEQHDVWSVNTEMEYHEESRGASPAGDRLIPTRVIPDELIKEVFAKLDPVALGVAIGSVSALTLLLAVLALLLKGGPVIGPNLGLLGHFLFGFKVTWSGAIVGAIEGWAAGFVLGYLVAWLRNWGLAAYAYLVKRWAENNEQRDLLDKI